MNILGTHDTMRILTALSGVSAYDKEEMSRIKLSAEQRLLAKNRLKVAVLLLFTLFGVPCIYYGDEIGMEGFSDPFCRCTFSWDNIDQDILTYYRQLGQIRANSSTFKDGQYTELYADKRCIVYERRKGNEVVVVCVNLGSNRYDLKYKGKLYDSFTGNIYLNKYTVQPESYTILSNKRL